MEEGQTSESKKREREEESASSGGDDDEHEQVVAEFFAALKSSVIASQQAKFGVEEQPIQSPEDFLMRFASAYNIGGAERPEDDGEKKATMLIKRPLAEGGIIESGRAMGVELSEIGKLLHIKSKTPNTTKRFQAAQFLYDLVVKLGLPRVRHITTLVNPRAINILKRGYIKRCRQYITEDMSDEDRAWWKEGEPEEPPMLELEHEGNTISYVDPDWLIGKE